MIRRYVENPISGDMSEKPIEIAGILLSELPHLVL